MPVRLTKSQREKFLRGRHVAVLVTIAEDGSPLPSPIWYLYRDGVFYFRTSANAVRTVNVRRDARVSICVQDERPPYRAVVVYGRAEVAPGEEWLAREIPRHYLGAVGAFGYQQAARSQIEAGAPEITLKVHPERWTSFDFTPETPLYGRAWLLLKRVLPPWI
jgi:PPOX class probable F420-dependent enzyme